ncbi:hypothetical protein H9L39_18076, partial [Fusarium oxysporum f. sp. albedinis]
AIQAVALLLALPVTILRGWVRFCLEHRAFTTPDYLVWCGWMFTLGWFACSIRALNLGIDHPVDPVTGATDSVEYLKFDLLRSLENQLDSIWNSVTDFIVNWALNITTDLSLFCLPFFVLNSLKLHRRQRIGLAGIFSLGMITMLISTARFVAYIVTDYQLDDPSGNAWCTIEMSTAVIVVSLPGLKSLFVQSRSPGNTTDRSTNGYIQTSSRQPSSNRPFASRARIEEATLDDELELISYGQNLSLATTRTPSEMRKPDIKDAVVVTTDFT